VSWPPGDFEGHQLCSKVLEILEIMGFLWMFASASGTLNVKFLCFLPTAVLI